MSLGRQGLDPRQGVPPPGGHGRSETPLWCSVLTAPPAAQHTCLYLPTWDRPYPPPGAGPPPARAALRACPAPALPRERPTHPPWQRVRVQMATLTFHKQALAQVAHSPAEPDTRGLTPQEGPCQSLGPGDQGCSDQARPCQRSRPGFHLLLSAAFTALPPTSMELAFSPQLDPRACTGLVPTGKCSSEFTRNQTAGQAEPRPQDSRPQGIAPRLQLRGTPRESLQQNREHHRKQEGHACHQLCTETEMGKQAPTKGRRQPGICPPSPAGLSCKTVPLAGMVDGAPR